LQLGKTLPHGRRSGPGRAVRTLSGEKTLQIAKLAIENFRGIREGTVQFSPHTVFVGANNCGKTTVVEALALLFGRDRMIRQLTEHDFYGSNPQPPDRIRLVATVIGFEGDDPAQHMDWFRDDRGVVKWWNPANGTVMPARADPTWRLACQVAFCARFHRPSLEVETLRYFHDDDAVEDVFSEESTTGFPARLIRDIGFFFVPAARTWDRTVSFGSELFRRVVAAGEGQPAESVLSERDRLRVPEARLEEDERPAPIVERLNLELRGFFRTAPKLHLRVTATDSDGLLESVVSHYAHEGADLPLPARRHGSGYFHFNTYFCCSSSDGSGQRPKRASGWHWRSLNFTCLPPSSGDWFIVSRRCRSKRSFQHTRRWWRRSQTRKASLSSATMMAN